MSYQNAHTAVCMTAQPDSQRRIDDRSSLRHTLILSCLPMISRYAWGYRERIQHVELCDLINEAMLAIVEHADEALDKESPIGWLLTIGRYRIVEYVLTQDTLIPHSRNHSHYPVKSLDRPIVADSAPLAELLTSDDLSQSNAVQKDYAFLYTALDKLSPARRQIIIQRFGLCGQPETPLCQMAPTRRDQQHVSKELTKAKQTLAKYIQAAA